MSFITFINKDNEEKTISLNKNQSITLGKGKNCDHQLEQLDCVDDQHVYFFTKDGKFYFKLLSDKDTFANLFYQDSFEKIIKGESRALGNSLMIRIAKDVYITYTNNEEAISGDTLIMNNTMITKISGESEWILKQLEKIHDEIAMESNASLLSTVLRHFFIVWPDISYVQVWNNANTRGRFSLVKTTRAHNKKVNPSTKYIREVIGKKEPIRKVVREGLMSDHTIKCNFSLSAILIPVMKRNFVKAIIYIESDTVIHEIEFDKMVSIIKLGGIGNLITCYLEELDRNVMEKTTAESGRSKPIPKQNKKNLF